MAVAEPTFMRTSCSSSVSLSSGLLGSLVSSSRLTSTLSSHSLSPVTCHQSKQTKFYSQRKTHAKWPILEKD